MLTQQSVFFFFRTQGLNSEEEMMTDIMGEFPEESKI